MNKDIQKSNSLTDEHPLSPAQLEHNDHETTQGLLPPAYSSVHPPRLWSRQRSSTSTGRIFGTFNRPSASVSTDRKRSSSAAVTIDSFSRKQSGTSGQTTITTHVVQNTSIFKQDPYKELPTTLTVVTEDCIGSGTSGDDQQVVLMSPDEELLRAQKREATPSDPLLGWMMNDRDMEERYPLASRLTATGNGHRRSSTVHHRQRKIALGTEDLIKPNGKHQRGSSLATFITSAQSNRVHLQKRPTVNLESFRIPRRWISLRNVISFFNIIILVLAITVVALVSYFAGVSSTKTAIIAMSNITLSDLTLKLDDVLGHAEDLNVFSQSIFTTPEYPVTQSIKAMRHLYFFMSEFDQRIDQMYVASRDSNFNGVAIDRLPDGTISDSTFLLKYYNRTTRPFRLTYRVNSSCQLNDTSCIMDAFDGSQDPLNNVTYNVLQRPFFEQALSIQRSGWTSVYQYPGESALTITAIRPVWLKGVFQFVCAVDITLTSLSDYLGTIAILIGGNMQTQPRLFITETNTGLLVATSSPKDMPIVNSTTGTRLSAQDSGIPAVQQTMNLLEQSFGNVTNIAWPEDGSPLLYESQEAHIIVGPYRRNGDDINWIITAYIPFATYSGRLNSAHYIEVPIAAVMVLVVAIMASVLVTRSIGGPLKQIAEEMLMIADLNFSEDLNGDQASDAAAIAQLQSEATSTRDLAPHWLCSWDAFLPFIKPRPSARKVWNSEDFKLKELKYLTTAMTAMKSGLKSFAKYVPIDVVALLMKLKREAVLGVDECELTIFFSDIVNFTTIAESIPPPKLVQLMSEYLSEMSDIIQESQGVVDKYIGDAIMAFWNAPLTLPDHASIACLVALRAQRRLKDLRQKWMDEGLPEVRARIGLNTGMALVGNLGSTTRLNYTCLGDTVNLASRLEGLNKRYHTEIMISEFTRRQIHPKVFVTRTVDVVAVKGKSQAVSVYELMDVRRNVSEELEQALVVYEDAFERYRQADFQGALDGFRRSNTVFERIREEPDHVTRLHMNTCERYLQQGSTPKDWDGVVYLEEK